jgi:tetratricopeptide (TPR) repeat protein
LKIALFIFVISLRLYSASAQKMPSDYFEEAGKFYENKEFDKALACYQYIVDHHPKNELYPKSFYNVGYIYYSQKNFEKAIVIFHTILKGNSNETANLGGDIMAAPYTNYRHWANEILSDIYYEKEKYDSSLFYFALSDTTNPYLHFCGNEFAANDIYTALRYADIYQKLNQPNQAIKKLLPAVFITLADNSMIIDELKQLLKGKPNLKSRLDESLMKIYVKTIQQNENSYERYYFKFLEAEIAIPDSYEYDKKKFDKQKAIKEIMLTDFYKMIAKL